MSGISIEHGGEHGNPATARVIKRTAETRSIRKQKHWLPILAGGIVAGGLDLICAYVSYGSNVPHAIAAGLLGRGAIHGGAGAYLLGIFLQFFIATIAAAIFYIASRRLYFLTEHFVICGLFYGIAVFLVMNLIVVPLSALHVRGPFMLAGLIQGLLIHMICIGLPIAFCVRRLSN
jgi:hypothetical protein